MDSEADEIKQEDVETEDVDKKDKAWTEHEVQKVVSNVLMTVGNGSFKSELKKVEWENMNLDNRSAEGCKSMFMKLTNKIRKHRTLNEILTEVTDSLTKSVEDINSEVLKKPISSFLMFCADRERKVREKNPNLTKKEITTKLRQKWEESEDIRNEYKQKYTDVYRIYRERKGVFTTSSNSNSKPVMPTPFFMYLKKKETTAIEENPKMDSRQLKSLLKKKYNNLSPQKKYHFMKKALKKIPEYKEKCEKCKKGDPKFEDNSSELPLSKEEKIILHDKMMKPQPVPKNCYLYYCTKERPKMKDLNVMDQSKLLAQNYSKLNDAQKTVIEGEFKETVFSHITELQQYKERIAPWSKTMADATAEEIKQFERTLSLLNKGKRKRSKKANSSASANLSSMKQKAVSDEESTSSDEDSIKETPSKSKKSPKTQRGLSFKTQEIALKEEDITPKKRKKGKEKIDDQMVSPKKPKKLPENGNMSIIKNLQSDSSEEDEEVPSPKKRKLTPTVNEKSSSKRQKKHQKEQTSPKKGMKSIGPKEFSDSLLASLRRKSRSSSSDSSEEE